MVKLEVYTRSFCPYCVRLLSILKACGIQDYTEISIDGQEQVMRQMLFERTGGRDDVPQVFFGERYLGDDDDLARLAQDGTLKKLLESA